MSDLAARFFARFKGLDRAHGTFIIKEKNVHKNKMEGKATTLSLPPTVEAWERHLSGKAGLGMIPITDNAACFWGAIDIDQYENFDMWALEEEITKLKLPLILCKTKSGGAHLYLFMREEVTAQLLRSRLMEWAIALGYPGVEVFPKQVKLASKEDTGNWINMPYFEGDKTSRYAYRDHKILSMEEFLEYASEQEVNEEQLKAIKLFNNEELDEAPPCLQHLCMKGFPPGTRNNGLFNLSVFAKQKYGDQWKEKIDQFNTKFMTPPLRSDEVQRTIKSADRKTYFYTCTDAPLAPVCNKVICLTRKYGIGNASDDLGVMLSGLTKIETAPPIWIIAVNGVRIEIENTEVLLSQAEFRQLCVERLNILPHRIKGEAWDKTIKTLLERVETVEAPEDASSVGQLLHLVEEFCLTRARAKNKDEILVGKPYKEDGFTLFRSMDLIKYLGQRKFTDINKANKIWNILRERGAQNKTLSINGRSCRIWAMPSPAEQTSDFEIPDVTEHEEY